jgi:hypothetical protein
LPCRRRFVAAAVLAALLLIGQSQVSAQQNPTADASAQNEPQSAKPESAEASLSGTQITPKTLIDLHQTLPNFSSCSPTELRHSVHELAHLKPDADQSRLPVLLAQIGAKTVEIAGKTPNLISHEYVFSVLPNSETRRNYSFLVLQHARRSQNRSADGS